MALDMGFPGDIEWAPRPGWAFGNKLTEAGYEDGETRLTLNEIKTCFENFKRVCDDEDELEQAQEFVSWTDKLWEERGFSPTSGITVITSS